MSFDNNLKGYTGTEYVCKIYIQNSTDIHLFVLKVEQICIPNKQEDIAKKDVLKHYDKGTSISPKAVTAHKYG